MWSCITLTMRSAARPVLVVADAAVLAVEESFDGAVVVFFVAPFLVDFFVELFFVADAFLLVAFFSLPPPPFLASACNRVLVKLPWVIVRHPFKALPA